MSKQPEKGKRKPSKRKMTAVMRPVVTRDGTSRVELKIESVINGDTMKVTLDWWQVRDLIQDLRSHAAYAAKELRASAEYVENAVR